LSKFFSSEKKLQNLQLILEYTDIKMAEGVWLISVSQ